jgi:exonuclease SbcD
VDAENVMRQRGVPLFGWESRCRVRDFDIFGLSLPYELCVTTVLNMLDLAGIALHRSERSQGDPIVIAGDVYDRPIPPPDAVELLDEVLSEIVLGTDAHVVLIAGNHDSAQRLTFGRRLLERNRLHIAGTFHDGNRLTVADSWGAVDLYALPYLDPAAAREELDSDAITDHESAARAMVACIRSGEMAPRSVLLAHAFVAGAATSESERPLLGGAGTVSPECFDGLSYVALGHLHRAQRAGGRDNLQYSGSIFKYSFSEEKDTKSFNVVEIGEDGECRIERIPLAQRRDVRMIEGEFAELMRTDPRGGRDDLLKLRLLDDRPVLDALARLREVFPNALSVEQNNVRPIDGHGLQAEASLPVPELFAAFFSQVTGEELAEDEKAEFESVLAGLAREERRA